MTRFARAKGSKASNEKIREEATPWHIMKQQLEDSLAKEKSVETKEKTKTARQLLEEKDKSLPVNNNWAEFDKPTKQKKSKVLDSGKIQKTSEKKIKKKKLKEALEKQGENNTDLVKDVSEKLKTKQINSDEQTKSKKSERKHISSNVSPLKNEEKKEKKMKKKKKRTNTETSEISEQTVSKQKKKKIENSEKSEENSEELKTKPTEKLSKRQKRNLKKKNQNSETANSDKLKKKNENTKTVNNEKKSVFDTKENDWNTEVNFGKSNKSFNSEEKSDIQDRNQNRFGRFDRQRANMKNHHLRKPKIRDDKEHQRRKPVPSTKLMINGMEIEVVMYDGFPIQKEDADRLKELKQQMVIKGIPKSEIDAAMKLERRKAEKSLARVRKQVCFHCRKAGHNLSDCPELGKEESATGICFKCGSTEHTHFECKVTKSDDYRYAKCFICREQGHIAKQCPDNPKGLYPKGGACNICGDVTHLKKDCPDAAREKEETTITVKTISDSALESIEEDATKLLNDKKETKKKVVKF